MDNGNITIPGVATFTGLFLTGLFLTGVFLGLVVILVLIFLWTCPELDPHLDPAPYSMYKHKLQTGDIIVLHNSGFISALIKTFDGSPATHSAIILVEGDDVLVCELDYYTYFSTDVKISPIGVFMEKQRSNIVGIIHNGGVRGLTKEWLSSLPCKFDLSMGLFPLPGRIHCSKFVYRVMKRFGILPHNGCGEESIAPSVYHSDPRIKFVNYDT
jgi:hypothetical protein